MRKLFILLCAALLLLSSCNAQGSPEQEKSLCVATWNMQNFFDAEENGNEYEEYWPSSGWSQSLYENRLSNARKVLSSLPQSGDYILIMNEIEGPKVVNDLIKSSGKERPNDRLILPRLSSCRNTVVFITVIGQNFKHFRKQCRRIL